MPQLKNVGIERKIGIYGELRLAKRGNAVPEGTTLLILGSFDTSFFDLVEERLVAHAEQLRRLAPVPVDLA